MKRWLVSFGGASYDAITAKTVACFRQFGADEFVHYDDAWLIKQPLFSDPRFQHLYTHRGVGNPEGGRGFGWFSWKPYVIADCMDRMRRGDVVLYLDADTYPIADFRMLYDLCEKEGGIFAFMATGRETALRNGDWTKRDCFIQMDMDKPIYRDAQAAVARFMLFQKETPNVSDFLETWQNHALDPLCQTFEPSTLAPEHPGFREHRCEQSVFSNLCHILKLKLHREACEFGKDCPQDWDLYPQLFSQTYSAEPKTLKGSRFANA